MCPVCVRACLFAGARPSFSNYVIFIAGIALQFLAAGESSCAAAKRRSRVTLAVLTKQPCSDKTTGL